MLLGDSYVFPKITTTNVLEVHTDEVWNLQWSHSGEYLAGVSKDKSAVIWRIEPGDEAAQREYVVKQILRDHPYSVGTLAWSLDDSILLTSSENHIKLWNAGTGICIRQLESHHKPVTALRWLPDDSGFVSGGLDRQIIIWDAEGNQRHSWEAAECRVADLAITPDMARMVVVGIRSPQSLPQESSSPAGSADNVIVVYDMATREQETVQQPSRANGELTCVSISKNSKYALINHAPNEVYLWDIASKEDVRRFSGQLQGPYVIRNCFGGVDDEFVLSGSEDGKVYMWHRETGRLLEALAGHGEGCVSAVAWNPKNERVFASCGDDGTIRIWEIGSW